MIRIGPFSKALVGGIAFSSFFAVLLPSAAQAACLQWEIEGQWEFVQSNGLNPVFDLRYRSFGKGPGLAGEVSYYSPDAYSPTGFTLVRGLWVTGEINGNSLKLTAGWRSGPNSVYTGTIDPRGRIQGTGPTTTVSWYSKQNVRCLTSDPGEVSPSTITPRAVIPPPVIKAQPRVKPGTQPGTVNPPLTICESARQARARNSPAAPGLEAQCTAQSKLAATGAAIAAADPVLAAARTVEPEALYWQGFDIATGIFGNPRLGAQGNTAMGPGSMRIRESLSPAGQRGFNASVALHLSPK